MKKIFCHRGVNMKKILSVILAVIIGVTASVNSFAASAKKTYISDIVAVTAKDEADAKVQLEKDGYKLLANSNVNSSLKTGVYIGYKETDNADEAIRDIAAMNMTGKFNYSDYKAILEQNRETIKETIDGFTPVIAEFQANYDEEKPAAVAAYKAMNVYKDDDSGKLMGDYLLEYDFSDAAEKKMTETFMQANSQIILTIMQQAAFAGDDNEDSMIDRLVKTGPDGIAKKYRGIYPTVAKANQAMAAEYGDTAAVIYNDWNSVYDYICETEKTLVTVDEDGNVDVAEGAFEAEEIDAEEEYGSLEFETASTALALNVADEVASNAEDTTDYVLYNFLNETEYGDGTLLDFFKRPASEVKKEELYPLVDAMSEGQRSQIELSGLRFTLQSAFSDIDSDAEIAEKAVETVGGLAESMGVTSIYDGMDRSIFEDGVAFTSAATEHEKLTGESWLAKLTGASDDKSVWLNTMIVSGIVTGALIATCITAALIERYQRAKEAAPLIKAYIRFDNLQIDDDLIRQFRDHEIETFKSITEFGKKGEEKAISLTWKNAVSKEQIRNLQNETLRAEATIHHAYMDAEERLDRYNDYYDETVGNTAYYIKCASFVLLIVALAFDIYAIYEYVTTPEATEEAIPHHLVSAATTEYGEDYVYYQTVKNLKGEAQDTNNHEADAKIGWLTLYTTKDKAAGDPILADNLKVQTGSASFREGMSFVHLFNETSAINLTSELYTGSKDTANGTYLVFERESSSLLIGSAVTNGTAALIGVGGLAVGAVLGALLTKLAAKKKKTSAEA